MSCHGIGSLHESVGIHGVSSIHAVSCVLGNCLCSSLVLVHTTEEERLAMNSYPFRTQSLKKRSLLDCLLGRQNRDNAWTAISNLLAETSQVQNIQRCQVDDVVEFYGVESYRKWPDQREDLLRRFIRFCISDMELTDENGDDIDHLSLILDITEETRQDIRLKESERLIQARIREATADLVLSPQEEAGIRKLATDLGIGLTLDLSARTQWAKYRLHWQIVNGDIPEAAVNINLQRGETCYFTANVAWLETRRRVGGRQWSGPTVRLRIAKGLYWRAGDLRVRSTSEDYWSLIEEGRVFLTSKRILFMSSRRNRTIRLSSIVDWSAFSNGILISKGTGKNPFLQFGSDPDTFGVILSRLIHDLTA